MRSVKNICETWLMFAWIETSKISSAPHLSQVLHVLFKILIQRENSEPQQYFQWPCMQVQAKYSFFREWLLYQLNLNCQWQNIQPNIVADVCISKCFAKRSFLFLCRCTFTDTFELISVELGRYLHSLIKVFKTQLCTLIPSSLHTS